MTLEEATNDTLADLMYDILDDDLCNCVIRSVSDSVYASVLTNVYLPVRSAFLHFYSVDLTEDMIKSATT